MKKYTIKHSSMAFSYEYSKESLNIEFTFDVSKVSGGSTEPKFTFGKYVLYFIKLAAKLALRCWINFAQ